MLSSLKRFVGRLILPDLTALHWRCYRRALQAKGLRGSLLRARVRRLQRKQCADIPIKQDITPFTTPHGLSGIFISKGAVIGEGCTLFQQVTVGSNTLQGSARYGAPVIGKKRLYRCGRQNHRPRHGGATTHALAPAAWWWTTCRQTPPWSCQSRACCCATPRPTTPSTPGQTDKKSSPRLCRAKLRKAAKGRPSGGVPGHKALAGRLPRELKALRGGRQKRLFACRGRTRTQARKAGATTCQNRGRRQLAHRERRALPKRPPCRAG